MNDATVPTTRLGTPIKEVLVDVQTGVDAGTFASTGAGAMSVGTADDNDLVLKDPSVSRYHLEIERVGAQVYVRDLGSTNRTRVGPAWVSRGEVAVTVPVTLEIGSTRLQISDGAVKMSGTGMTTKVGHIESFSPAMFPVLEELKGLADTDVPILLLGESGAGKELFAQTIHSEGARRDKKFVTVDCAALTPAIFMSELFGHERGAFTGAQSMRRGAFERADGGTVFLDELGELPPEQQTALLGVLERRKFTRVGGDKEIEVDIRVIAATNRDLRAEVNSGRFRLDLYYRLAVALLRIPPLRKRKEDIPLLIRRFLIEEGHDGDIADVYPDAELKRLVGHAWPGNVRELRNVVMASFATGKPPRLDDGLLESTAAVSLDYGGAELPPYRDARRAVTDEFEAKYLTALMEREGTSIRGAARLAKMDRSYLTELLRRHGLK